MAFYTTRHWQTSGRLVQTLNICTVFVSEMLTRQLQGSRNAVFSFVLCQSVMNWMAGKRTIYQVVSEVGHKFYQCNIVANNMTGYMNHDPLKYVLT